MGTPTVSPATPAVAVNAMAESAPPSARAIPLELPFS